MPYKDPMMEKKRSLKRREYFRLYRRLHPQKYKYRGSSLGYKGEEIALKVLIGSKRIYHPSDLEWRGKLIEVKTAIKSTMYESKNLHWRFYLKRQFRKIDLFLFICQDKEKRVEYIFLIPDKEIKVPSFSLAESKVNKYSRFLLSL